MSRVCYFTGKRTMAADALSGVVKQSILAASAEKLPAFQKESLSRIYKRSGQLSTAGSAGLKLQPKQYVWVWFKSRLNEIINQQTKEHKCIRA